MTTLLALAVMAAQGAPASVDPAQIELALQRGNAGAVVAELWGGDGTEAKMFLRGVGTGAPKWLHAARSLYPATDAGSRSELDDALAAALVAAPYSALPILRELWWQGDAARVCVFESDSELPGGVREYIRTLEHALGVTPPKGLAAVRGQCLLGLRRTRTSLGVQ